MRKLSNIKNYRLETRLFKNRLLVATVIIFSLVLILIFRLMYLQIVEHDLYQKLSEKNQIELVPTEPNRGLIYDRNGVLLAQNEPVFTLSIIPDRIPDLEQTIAELQKIINITPENLKLFKKNLAQHQKFDHIPLKLKLTELEVENFHINQYHFPGVIIDANMIRYYPFGNYTASVVGYVGRINAEDLENIDTTNYRASNFIGKTGIEKFYEDQLHGNVGYRHVEVDAAGHIVKTLKNIAPVPGENLYLTIDINLQKAASDAFGDLKGSVVAIDPSTGEVLALVSNPSYDPNLFAYGIDNKTFQSLLNSEDKPMFNRAIRGLFPLASNIKPFIALQLLNTGIVNPYTSIYDPGWFKLPNSEHVYWDWVHTGHGSVNVSKAIMESCDTYFYNMATKLGIEKIGQILNLFGFGKKTEIDLGEEQQGIVASPQWKMQHTGKIWYPGDTVISIIGQGFMSTTPLQLAHATAIIAKRGLGYKPHLLLKNVTANGEINIQKPIPENPIILKNKNYWEIVINAMQEVVKNPQGTARGRFGTDFPYTVAGKTGGAQLYHHKYNREGATPEDEAAIPKRLRNHSLFIAFAPVKNPKIAIAIVVENCNDAPKIARKILDYYLVPPDMQKPTVPKKTQSSTANKTPEGTDNNSDENEDEDSNYYDDTDETDL